MIVILISNKDIVNTITFNWTKMLKSLIIPTASFLFQLRIYFNGSGLVMHRSFFFQLLTEII